MIKSVVFKGVWGAFETHRNKGFSVGNHLNVFSFYTCVTVKPNVTMKRNCYCAHAGFN